MRRLFSAFFLLFVFIGALATLPMFRFQGLVIHHSATEDGDYQSIRRAHEGRWFDIAYHLVLARNEKNPGMNRLETGKRHFFMMQAAATRNRLCNFTDLHLCIAANLEEHPPTEQMKHELVSAIRVIGEQYHIPVERIKFHRECSSTACPGRYLDRASLNQWLATIEPDPAMLEAHRKALQADYLGPVPRGPLLVVLPVLFLLLVFRAPLPNAPSVASVSGDGDA